MAESYELRTIEDEISQHGQVDDARERLLSKTSDEILDDEIRRLQHGVDGDEPYLPRKSSEDTGDGDHDMEEMVNRVSLLSVRWSDLFNRLMGKILCLCLCHCRPRRAQTIRRYHH